MRYGELVGGGDRDDSRHHGRVKVVVGGAGQPARVLGGGERPRGGLLAAGEVEPPQRYAICYAEPRLAARFAT